MLLSTMENSKLGKWIGGELRVSVWQNRILNKVVREHLTAKPCLNKAMWKIKKQAMQMSNGGAFQAEESVNAKFCSGSMSGIFQEQ